jgi:hypothetical protein
MTGIGRIDATNFNHIRSRSVDLISDDAGALLFRQDSVEIDPGADLPAYPAGGKRDKKSRAPLDEKPGWVNLHC